MPNLNIASTAHHLHEEEERWVVRHSRLIALIAACLITAGVIYLLSGIHFYLKTGAWPLWG